MTDLYESSVFVVEDAWAFEPSVLRCIFSDRQRALDWVRDFGSEATIVTEVELDPPSQLGRESGRRRRTVWR